MQKSGFWWISGEEMIGYNCVNQSLNSAGRGCEGRVTRFCVRHALLSTCGLERFRDFVRVNAFTNPQRFNKNVITCTNKHFRTTSE